MNLAVEARAGAVSVIECDLPRQLECPACGNAHEGAVDRAAGERVANDVVVARREQERQRRRAVAEIGAGDLGGLDRRAGAVEDVVDDLERDA